MKIKFILYSTVIILLLINSCTQNLIGSNFSLINTTHLDSLYEQVIIDGRAMGIIHIYSEYPDYQRIGDDDEGIACIDDVARAVIFYLKHYKITNKMQSLIKSKMLIEFILFMQTENGFFYNFIFEGYSINKVHVNSVAGANWWSWRAIWALSESYKIFMQIDENYAKKLWGAYSKSIIALKESVSDSKQTKVLNGFIKPTWLPHETASDQTAVQILCLSNYYDTTKNAEAKEKINHLSDGILLMQCKNNSSFSNGSFLSWRNTWHGWGNSQSYALLYSSHIIAKQKMVESALYEINHFYRYLIEQQYQNEIGLKKNNNIIEVEETIQFPQIAYMIRPMVYACLEAYNISKDSNYAELAGKITCWLFGDNIAKRPMYNPETGIVYDGIESKAKINHNSGAESTIEGLLTILAAEQNPISKKIVHKYYKSRNLNHNYRK